jgi:hypothetical protein
MMAAMAWRFIVLAVAGCGRFGFESNRDAGNGDDATDAVADAAIDTPVGLSCSSDVECGRGARCDSNNRCAIEPVVELFLGHRGACYVGIGGERWCTGYNAESQLGLGDMTNRSIPVRALDGGGWTSIKMTYYGDTIGERGGQFYRWGNNTLTPQVIGPSRPIRGLLGDINTPCFWEMDGTSSCPGASGPWSSLAVGGDHSCGVRADGSLWCWGTNRSNALGNATFLEEQTVAAPSRVGASNNWVGVGVGGKGIATANGGKEMSCAKKTDGRIYCWGHPALTGTNGADVGAVPTAISADTDWAWFRLDWEHGCAGKGDNSVWCWGRDSYGGYVVPGQADAPVPTRIPGTFTRWLMGGHHACGLTAAGWHCFGLNTDGQLGIGTTTTSPQFVGLCP